MPKGKQNRVKLNFKETKSERSATHSYQAFREQFVKMAKKLKGKIKEEEQKKYES